MELIEITRHPPIGHMDKQECRAGHARKWSDMRKDGLISPAVFERNENMLIHRCTALSRQVERRHSITLVLVAQENRRTRGEQKWAGMYRAVTSRLAR